MFLYVKRCFAVDTERLNPLHTSLTGENSKALVKDTASKACVQSCRLFAYFCYSAQIKNYGFPSRVQLRQEERRHLEIPGDTWRRGFSRAELQAVVLVWGNKIAFGRRRGESATFPSGARSNAMWPGTWKIPVNTCWRQCRLSWPV